MLTAIFLLYVQLDDGAAATVISLVKGGQAWVYCNRRCESTFAAAVEIAVKQMSYGIIVMILISK